MSLAMFDGSAIYTAGNLFGIAVSSYDRMPSAPTPAAKADAALISIVFSALTLEGFLNEFMDQLERDKDPQLQSIGEVLAEAESLHSSTKMKLYLLNSLFSGKPANKGAAVYQDAVLLVDIRNALVHPKPATIRVGENDEVHVSPGPLFRRLKAKKLLGYDDGTYGAIAGQLSNDGAARWAINTTVAAVQAVIATLPEGTFKQTAIWMYRFFTPVKEHAKQMQDAK